MQAPRLPPSSAAVARRAQAARARSAPLLVCCVLSGGPGDPWNRCGGCVRRVVHPLGLSGPGRGLPSASLLAAAGPSPRPETADCLAPCPLRQARGVRVSLEAVVPLPSSPRCSQPARLSPAPARALASHLSCSVEPSPLGPTVAASPVRIPAKGVGCRHPAHCAPEPLSGTRQECSCPFPTAAVGHLTSLLVPPLPTGSLACTALTCRVPYLVGPLLALLFTRRVPHLTRRVPEQGGAGRPGEGWS